MQYLQINTCEQYIAGVLTVKLGVYSKELFFLGLGSVVSEINYIFFVK